MGEEAKADLTQRAEKLKAWAESMPPEWRQSTVLTTIDQVAFAAEALSIMLGCIAEKHRDAKPRNTTVDEGAPKPG